MRSLLPFVVVVVVVVAAGSVRAQEAEAIAQTGPAENRIDLVITGDGYTADEQDDLRAEAVAAFDRLLGSAPYDHHRDLFNTWVVYAVSNESGADHPSRDFLVDTAFDGTFDTFGVERLVTVNDRAVSLAVNAEVPEWDYILVSVNDVEYGGSGGAVTVFTRNGSADELVRHEFSHTYADLADEYEAAYVPATDDHEPNVSFPFARAELKWAIWVDAATPLPTPIESATADVLPVGAYEGAKYTPTGIYRPAPNCKMRSLGSALCSVCSEAIVLHGWYLVDPIDAVLPAEGAADVSAGATFAAMTALGTPPLSIAWTIDGSPAGSGASLTLAASDVPPGSHDLALTVRDPTALVRNDPEALCVSTRSWTISGGSGAADADADSDGDADGEAGADADADDVPGDSDDADGSADSGSGGDDGCGCRASGSSPASSVFVVVVVVALVAGFRRRR